MPVAFHWRPKNLDNATCRRSVQPSSNLKEGDDIEIHITGPKPDRHERVARLKGFRGRLPADFRFDRDEANVR